MKNIYLVRHCQAAGQQPEAPLTDQGREDAERRLVDFFIHKNIEAVLSSPFTRAIDTIQPLARKIAVSIEVDERLKERVLSSETLDDWLAKLELTYEDLKLKYAGGESSEEAMSRGIEVIEALVKRPETNSIVVTHGALLSLLIKRYNPAFGFKEWKTLSNPDVYLLEIDRGSANVKRVWG